jgi:hypothetical protein
MCQKVLCKRIDGIDRDCGVLRENELIDRVRRYAHLRGGGNEGTHTAMHAAAVKPDLVDIWMNGQHIRIRLIPAASNLQ